MSDIDNHFHEFALHSALFKGRSDWYFCFLKSQKIAHVLVLLGGSVSGESTLVLRNLSRQASRISESIVRFAAAEIKQESLLAHIFALVAAIRFAAVAGDLSPENALLISQEYERIAQKLGQPGSPSPFISSEDLSVPQLSSHHSPTVNKRPFINDPASLPYKRQLQAGPPSKGQTKNEAARSIPSRFGAAHKQDRLTRILDFLRKQQGASIKEICSIVKDCGEKTIQRELATLISQGLVRREGERRWSIYRPVSGI